MLRGHPGRPGKGGLSMKVRVFTLPWRPEGGFDDAEVQEFLEGRTALDVSQHFFVHEKAPVLVLVVTWREGAPRPRPSHGDSGHAPNRNADPVPDLTGEELRRYEALRAWRNQYARRVGRPPYAVFTNRQAADLVRRVPMSRAQLAQVPGLGASRLDDFGEELVAFLGSLDGDPGEGSAGG